MVHFINWLVTAGLKATNGEALTAINRSFTTLGSFLPAGVFAYWNLTETLMTRQVSIML